MKVFFNFWVCENGRGYLVLFGCYVFYCGGGNGDNMRHEELCGKSLLIIYDNS